MKILLFGSTYLTALVEKNLQGVIGHVPSHNPAFLGKMTSPVVSEDTPYDIALSVQYDAKIKNLTNAYNLHTGLLPLYGGCDILYHTLENGESEQGLTFHKITDKFDEGEILSKISYPVLPSDTALELYKKMCALAPDFVNACLKLIEVSNKGSSPKKPVLYKRGDISNKDRYQQDLQSIKSYVNA